MPRISVLMPVYNAASYVAQSITSVLTQTFSDFELLIVDDGSTDDTAAVVQRHSDSRIRMIANNENLGVALSLNRGLEAAQGEYVARLDSDDTCMPQRLERQVAFMDHNPAVGACGTWIRLVGAHHGTILRRPCGPAAVAAFSCLDNPLFHPSVILRRAVLEQHDLKYRDIYPCAEDFDLWTRLQAYAALDNLSEALVNYRVHEASVTLTTPTDMEQQTCAILRGQLSKLDIAPTEDELRFHRNVGHCRRLESRDELVRAETWLLRLAEANRDAQAYDENGMSAALGFVWFGLCANNASLGPWSWRQYRASALRTTSFRPAISDRLRFWLSMIRHIT